MCRVAQMGDSGLSLGGGPEFILRIGPEFGVRSLELVLHEVITNCQNHVMALEP